MAKTLVESFAAVQQLEDVARTALLAEQEAKATRETAAANLQSAWKDLEDSLVEGAKASAILGGSLGTKLGVEPPSAT